MRRLSTFIVGMLAGGLLVYGALHYHLILTQDGLHVVPKVEARLATSYLDVRQFSPADWARHADVAMALFSANRTDLLQAAAGDAMLPGLDQALPSRSSRSR